MSRCAYDSTDFGHVYWGLDLPQSVMSDVWSGYRRLDIRHCVHTVNRYIHVPGTRTCGNQLAWCDNGRLIFTVSIQTAEFVNGPSSGHSRNDNNYAHALFDGHLLASVAL